MKQGLESVHEYDIDYVDKKTGQIKKISVPVCVPENIGSDMCIDEKKIGEEFFTIISNRNTSNIAFMANTTNSSELIEACIPIKEELKNVKIINRDLASSYRRFSNIAMPEADQVGDKFHVVKLLFEAGQSVRIGEKNIINTEKREAYEDFKKKEKAREEKCQKNGKQYKKRKFEFNEKIFSNGETQSELLTRSRYLLYKFPEQWNEKQEYRSKILFSEFPKLEKTYKLICNFRNWYSKKNIGAHELFLEKGLYQWYEDVEISGITELMNFSSTVERNQEYILNYFYNNGASNAKAENTNGQIKKFINSNQGTRDRDFFFFRLTKYFT